jgi:hypothetical protein
MKNANSAKGDLLPYKMDIDLDVFCPPMLHWIMRQVNRTDIITEDNCGSGDRSMKLL